MKRVTSRHIAIIATLALFGCTAYYCLLLDNCLHISISAIISQSHDLEIKKHLLVLGLLPFYISLMIFGTALLGIYLGSYIHSWYHKFKKRVLRTKLTA